MGWPKGKPHSPATRRKMSVGHKGKTLSEETKTKISESLTGQRGNNWQGGRTKDIHGYILVWQPEHPYLSQGNYVKEHRLVMERDLGRYLSAEEVVHHENGINEDNRIENLRLFSSNAEHLKYHKDQRRRAFYH